MSNFWRMASGVYKVSMGGIGKQYALRLPNQCKTFSAYSRTMWHMCSPKTSSDVKYSSNRPANELCQCGCGRFMHTKGEKSLADFLKTEIVEERKAQKMTSLPRDLGGFSIEADGAELSFKKKDQNETITLTMNVNHSVDADDGGAGDGYADEMKSRPTFEVDITRNNSTLNFCCSYVGFVEPEEGKSDAYQIDEVALYDGEWNEKNYSVAGDILDENLYDLFMSLLNEKGITNEFIEEVSDIATYYEHSKYINLLENIQKFSSAN